MKHTEYIEQNLGFDSISVRIFPFQYFYRINCLSKFNVMDNHVFRVWAIVVYVFSLIRIYL